VTELWKRFLFENDRTMNTDEAELDSKYIIALFSRCMQTGVLGSLH